MTPIIGQVALTNHNARKRSRDKQVTDYRRVFIHAVYEFDMEGWRCYKIHIEHAGFEKKINM